MLTGHYGVSVHGSQQKVLIKKLCHSIVACMYCEGKMHIFSPPIVLHLSDNGWG